MVWSSLLSMAAWKASKPYPPSDSLSRKHFPYHWEEPSFSLWFLVTYHVLCVVRVYEPCLEPLFHRVTGICQLMVEDLVVGTGGPIIRPSVRGFKLLVTGGNEVIWVQHRETNKLVIWLDYDVKPPLGRKSARPRPEAHLGGDLGRNHLQGRGGYHHWGLEERPLLPEKGKLTQSTNSSF